MKASAKRTYTRVMVPSAIVVFAAIAIAQGQKDKSSGTPSQPREVAAAASAQAQPIPLVDSSPVVQAASSTSASYNQPAAAEFPVDHEPSAWSQTTEIDASDSLAPELPDAYPLPEDPIDASEPPPMLPDVSSSPLPEQETIPSAPAGRNPYRSGAAPLPGYGPAPLPPETDSGIPSSEPLSPALEEDLGASATFEEGNPSPAPTVGAAPAPTFDEPPALPEATVPTYDPLPSADSTDLVPNDRLDTMANPTASDSVSELLETGPSAPAVRAVDSYQEPLGTTAPPVGMDPLSPQATEPAAIGYRDTTESSIASEIDLQNGSAIQSTGKPGPQILEGPQTPSLTLEKIAPSEIQVGAPAKIEIRVRNVGQVTAENVMIRDEVPMGTNFVDANPQASPSADGAILWEVGNMAPGEEATVTMDVMPVSEGQVGSVATVSFQASATARSRSTKPELALEHTGPKQVLVGEAVRFAIKLSNPGTGAATQVVLEEDVPTGLAHSSGAKLEYAVGRIEPGQTRHLELTLKAAQPGQVINTLIARADTGLLVKDSIELEVVSPKLQVGVEGPSKRYLERQATFTVSVANPGTAPAHDVELVAQLPPGLKFVSTNNSGYYDQNRHAVIWSLQQLPAGEMGKAQFTALATDMGEQRIRAEGKAQMGLESTQDLNLVVEGIAALLFNVSDQVDPVELNGQTSYEIKVVNQGSKAATNVRIAALVPDGLQPLRGQGPTVEQIQGQRILFEPLSRLEPKQEVTFRVMVQGNAAGDHRFRVQLSSDEMSEPVIKEESTRVYRD